MRLLRRDIRRLGAAVLLALALLPAPARAQDQGPRPEPQGSAAILLDAGTGETLFAERPAERHPIASTTKLMTALLTLERADLDARFTAAPYDPLPAESRIDLRPGERMRVRDLLVALMLESANDASVTLAQGIAGSRPAFVGAMNDRARELGLTGTSYANPVGLDDPRNFSTARDLATLARRLMRDPRFRQIVDLPRAALRSGARPRVVDNRNLLVERFGFVDGVKTGHTRSAGYVLVGSASRPGARVISVVLGEPSEAARDADSVALLRWGLGRFRRVEPVARGQTVARAEVSGQDGRRIGLKATRAVEVTVRRGERVTTRVRAPQEVAGPLPAGRRVGTVSVVYRGRTLRSTPIVTAGAVPEPPLLRHLAADLSFVFVAGLALLLAAPLAVIVWRRTIARKRAAAPS